MIVRAGMTVAALGTAAGLVAAQYGSRLLPAPGTWWASAGAAAIVLAFSFFACAIPAIRALRLHPAALLRQE
jgi:ABC-type antimicrobial peptide transport system permease subunit